MIAMWGPAAKPGDQARISDIQIKDAVIHFEINGGPVKKQKWYQRIQVGGAGGSTPIAPSDSNANPRGSYVDLVFDHYVPDLTPQQLKDQLRPVFDFDAKSAVEAYLETVPAPVKDAIKNHHVLVSMNREMVAYADREKKLPTPRQQMAGNQLVRTLTRPISIPMEPRYLTKAVEPGSDLAVDLLSLYT